ncbi:MAG: ABC transporter permease [Peptoniphilaceae bacterium]
MIKVKNKKAINNLSDKNLKATKSRNIIAIIAIALTTILFTSLFTIGIGMVESIQNETMRQSGSSAHGSFKNIRREEYNKLKTHSLVDEMAVNILAADSIENDEFLKRHFELWYNDETALEWGYNNLTEGNMPQVADEIAIDTKSLELLEVPAEVGQKVTLKVKPKPDSEVTSREFIVTGLMEANNAINAGFGFVSESYLEKYADELVYSYDKDYSPTGAIRAEVKFKNTLNIESKLEKVIEESGFSNIEDSPNYIEANPNWAYVTSSGVDIGGIIAIILSALLIALAGYLIIYNIFQISITRDIRFYGLLKTIGTTEKQIKHIIRRQALILSIIGIPLGLIIGFIIGKLVLPIIIGLSNIKTGAMVSINPIIFIASAVFSLFTVFVSTRKPSKIAQEVSPVEAMRYSGNDGIKKKTKSSTKGAKLHKMAFSNLLRNRKRTIVTIVSVSLSLVLLNTVFTISKGFDINKFIEKFVDTDFLIADAEYFNSNYNGADQSLSEKMITAVENRDEFIKGGRLYSNGTDSEYFTVEDEKNIESQNVDNEQDNFFALVYGLEDFPMSRLKILEGEIDLEKLSRGDYILEGVYLDDNGNADWKYSHFDIGDKVVLHNNKGIDDSEYTTKEFTVMAKVAVNHYTNSIRWRRGNYSFYLPAEVYKSLVDRPGLMSYVFDVEKGREEEMESFVKDYTENRESTMHYESKQVYVDEFKGIKVVFITLGLILSGIVGLIGIVNFINSIFTSIFSREREFAILQAIGMTKKQLIKMLIFEGGYYSVLTIITSLILGIAFSVSIVAFIANKLWFFSYKFTITPLLIIFPILVLISLIIPMIAYKSIGNISIVERLREVE